MTSIEPLFNTFCISSLRKCRPQIGFQAGNVVFCAKKFFVVIPTLQKKCAKVAPFFFSLLHTLLCFVARKNILDGFPQIFARNRIHESRKSWQKSPSSGSWSNSICHLKSFGCHWTSPDSQDPKPRYSSVHCGAFCLFHVPDKNNEVFTTQHLTNIVILRFWSY